MAKKPFRSKIKHAVYIILSFLLSVTLFALSICTVLQATIFNSNFIMDNMNSSNYFIDKRDEITNSLEDLGNASGLKEVFFADLLDEVMISNNTREYLENFYSGEGTKIDTTEFKQTFNNALDKYIEDNKIKNVNNQNRDYMVKKAAQIYRSSLEIPLFSRISGYFISSKNAMPFVIAGLIVFGAVICLILFFTNEWKHRFVKYICFATSGTFLTVGIMPALILATGKINQINLASRALYNLFVQCANSICIALIFCSLFFLLVSIGLFFQYRRMRKKA